MIDQIIVPASAQRPSAFIFLLIGLVVFCIGAPFIKLLYNEIQSTNRNAFNLAILGIIILSFLGLEYWLWSVYNNPKEIKIVLQERGIQVSESSALIPLAEVEASIEKVKVVGVLNGFVFGFSAGEGLVFKIVDLSKYVKIGAIDQLTTTFQVNNQIRLMIPQMISRETALSFAERIQAQKSSAK